ncbi:MAG TPA: GAF domain-containing protein, partial [Armatimonadota bacterium]|nr:GAF domain-containing protein [Armatimonadota bacterium]
MYSAEIIVGLAALPANATLWLFAAVISGITAGGIVTAWALRSRHLRLQAAAEVEQRRAAVLDEAYRAFASSLDLETTLERVIRASTDALGDSCYIQLIEPGSERLRPACAIDQRTGEGQALHAHLLGHPIRLGEGLSGQVAATGKPLLVTDFASSPHALPEFPGGETVPSVIAVPLLVDGRVTGVLTSAYSTTERLPEAEDLRLAVLLADRAAIAIEHAQLYRQLETRVEERTRELRETHRRLLEAEHRRALCELAAVVAHEIRNPLNVVKTASYYVRERVQGQDERVDRQLERLERSVDAATYIIQDLMDYGAFPDPN